MSAVHPSPHVQSLGLDVLVVIGVSGCGKTTVASLLAERLHYQFVDADDFHTLEHKAQMAAGIPLTDAQRFPWIDRLGVQLCQNAQCGLSSVLAFSGLKAMHRQRLRACQLPLQFIYLSATPSRISERMKCRQNHFMPVTLLENQLATLELPVGEADVMTVNADADPEQIVSQVMHALADRRIGSLR